MIEERYLDDDEREVVNRPADGPDDWLAYCVTEEKHMEILRRASEEQKKAEAEIAAWYDKVKKEK